jgi:hypothetical protein
LEFDSKHPDYSHMAHLLPEALQDLMTARNLNLFLLAVRMTSAGAARREAILDVIAMKVNPKVVKGCLCRQNFAAIAQRRALIAARSV